MCIVSAETVLPALATLAVFAALLAMLKLLKNRGLAFTPRVFTALGLGIALGVGIQLALGRGSDAALWALDWIAVVGQGYIALLKMLVMPLVFVAIVGAFTRTKVTENLGRISVVVLAVLLGTVAVAALVGWAGAAFTGLAGASFTADAGSDAAAAAAASALQDSEQQVADLTLPQEILSFIPSNVFADFAGSRPTSTIAVVIFSAIVGVAYLRLRDRDSAQAAFFQQLVDSLYGIVMRIVAMVLGLAPYGVLALIAHVMASSDYRAVLDLGKFVLVSYAAIAFMFVVHALVLLANRASPLRYAKRRSPCSASRSWRARAPAHCRSTSRRKRTPWAWTRPRPTSPPASACPLGRTDARASIPPCWPPSSRPPWASTCSRPRSWRALWPWW